MMNMKTTLKRGLIFLLISSLAIPVLPAYASSDQAETAEADENYYADDDPLGVGSLDEAELDKSESGKKTEGESEEEDSGAKEKLKELEDNPTYQWFESQNTDGTLLRNLFKSYEIVYSEDAEWEDDLITVKVGEKKKKEFVEYIGPMCMGDAAVSGILASVTIAQAILESGWGQSRLTKEANNLFGIKAGAKKTTWSAYSTWTGSYVAASTSEQLASGSYIRIVAKFRAYDSIQASIADHSAYLANAQKNGKLRYGGLVGCTDYKKAAKIIQAGGYATNHDYAANLIKLIERFDLTQFDSDEDEDW